MAFAAVIAATAVAFGALIVASLGSDMPALLVVAIAIGAGQTAFFLVILKAMACRAMRRGREVHPLRA